MLLDTNERLELILVHDILVLNKITKPLSYMELCEKLADEIFVKWLRAYKKLMQ